MWITFSQSAPGSADSTLDCMQDFEPLAEALARSAWWRGKPSASRTWFARCKRGGWITALYGVEISETFPPEPWWESIGYAGDTHVSPSAKQESDWEKTTLVICGRSSSTSSELFDLAASSSRTSPVTCRSASIASFKTWQAAVSAARSDCLQRRKSARHIDESESSSSGWPTPVCAMMPCEGSVRLLRKAVDLGMSKEEADAMLGGDISKPQGRLPAWPTPLARDHQDGDATANVPTNGLLGRAVPRDPTSRPGRLNPDWVEMLMGFPIGWTDCGR